MIITTAIGYLRKKLSLILEDTENELTSLLRDLINELKGELIYLNSKITMHDKRVDSLLKKEHQRQHLDKYAELTDVTTNIETIYHQWQSIEQEHPSLRKRITVERTRAGMVTLPTRVTQTHATGTRRMIDIIQNTSKTASSKKASISILFG